jgi:hypothetical protein
MGQNTMRIKKVKRRKRYLKRKKEKEKGVIQAAKKRK